jgi:hypothetical protein
MLAMMLAVPLGMYIDYLVYFMTICYEFGIVYYVLVYFISKKSGNPARWRKEDLFSSVKNFIFEKFRLGFQLGVVHIFIVQKSTSFLI